MKLLGLSKSSFQMIIIDLRDDIFLEMYTTATADHD